MLTPGEQDFVKGVLAASLAADGNVRQFIQTTFGLRSQPILRDLPADLVLPDRQASFILMQCLDARWPPPAPPLASLLELLLQTLITGGADLQLVAMRDRVRQGEASDPNPDPFKAFWVNDTLPFFSRSTLRPVVKMFLANNAQPILKILGPKDVAKSGKSYTRWLIDHVCNSRIDHHVLLAEVAGGAGPSSPVEDLADALAFAIPQHPPRPARAASNYPAALARWLINAALNIPGRWVFVLDGFNQPDVQPEAQELARTLAQLIAGPGDIRRRVRLVLIDYSVALPNVHLGTVLSDTAPDPRTITAGDLADCLKAHYDDLTARGKPNATVSANTLAQTASGLLADAMSNGVPNLQRLNDGLTLLRQDDLKA